MYMKLNSIVKSLKRFFPSLLTIISILVVPLFALPLVTSQAYADSASWTYTGSMNSAREDFGMVLLQNGKVLVAGGEDNNGNTLSSAELYDPATGTWTPTGSMNTPRWSSGGQPLPLTLLPNGKVLVAGGAGNGNPLFLSSAELYDPATGTWTPTGSMNTVRIEYTATLLPNGKVLVAGGGDGHSPLSSAELYDPSTGTWSYTGSMNIARGQQTATLLTNGEVLVVGGSANNDASAELYDPTTGTWTYTGSTNFVRLAQTATLLPDGKVLVAGGFGTGIPPTPSAELYDPTTGTWTYTGSMITGMENQTATLLPDGKVLVAVDYPASSTAQIYDPSNGTWSLTASMNALRRDASAVLLPNGKVMVAGGSDNNSDFWSSAELYSEFNLTVGAMTVSPNPVQINTATTASANFTDTDPSATSHTAQWNWGDGNTTTGTVTEPNGSTPGSVSDSHTYTAPGVYTVTLTVTNNNGTSGSSTYQYVSAYDPTPQGLFTGARLFNNPSSASPSTSGQVQFGIVAKYSGSAPTGNVSMNFTAANLKFVATTVTTLVIANGKATLQGSGTVNGQTGYTFAAVGMQNSQTGYIRFQIKDSSGNVAYDSQPGAALTADPTTPVTGQVIIH
jgi:PKD repeat protein